MISVELTRDKDKCFNNISNCDEKLVEILSDFNKLQDMNWKGANNNNLINETFIAKNFLAIYTLGVGRGISQAQLAIKNLYNGDSFNKEIGILSGRLGIKNTVARVVDADEGASDEE
jgi:hypothetical protein